MKRLDLKDFEVGNRFRQSGGDFDIIIEIVGINDSIFLYKVEHDPFDRIFDGVIIDWINYSLRSGWERVYTVEGFEV